MKITTVKIEDLSINYPFELIADPKEIIFVDIETTGFTARSSKLYMIGCGYQVMIFQVDKRPSAAALNTLTFGHSRG